MDSEEDTENENQNSFSRNDENNKHTEELQLIKTTKFICSVDHLDKLWQNILYLQQGCTQPSVITSKKLQDCTHIIYFKWTLGHKFTWCSSREYDGLFTNNIQTASAVLISGNNYSKLKHYADCLGLNFITSSTFHRIQNLYCIPAIEDWWSWMRETILQQLQVQNITLSRDEKCDSPGHSAKYIFVLLLDGLHRLLDCPCWGCR